MKKILFFLLFALFLIPGYAFSGEVASRGVAVREVEADRVSLRVMAQADAEGQAEAVRNAGEIAKIIEKEMEKFPPDRVTV